MKRIELPGYDVNYRDGRDHDTPAGKKIAELNSFLRENGIEGGIACLDEKGETVMRYTNNVVLEIDDSVSGEKLEQIKEKVLELLRIMGATETQLKNVFEDEVTDEIEEIEEIEGANNMRRFKLPGYDVNYRDGRDHDTPAGKKIAELNSFLRENGIEGGIACLDEKGETVMRYTNNVVLEIDDSVSGEKLEQIKEIASELLGIMKSTDS